MKLLKEKATKLTLEVPSVQNMHLHLVGTCKYPKQGVYFLFNKDKELIYIGETENYSRRLYGHAHTNKWFQQEAYYIAFLPKMNRDVLSPLKWRASILQARIDFLHVHPCF